MKILTHYDGDGIFSAAVIQLLENNALNEQFVFSSEFFSKELLPVIKIIKPKYVLDLGNGFLKASDFSLLEKIWIFDHHMLEYEKFNPERHILVPEAPSTGYLIFKRFENEINSLDKEIKKWAYLFTYCSVLSDVGIETEEWKEIEDIFRNEIPFAFVNISQNFTYAGILSYKINILKRFLYENSVKFAFKVLREVMQAGDLSILGKNMGVQEIAKYPAVFTLNKLIEQYKNIESLAQSFVVSNFQFNIGYLRVRIIFFEHEWDISPFFYKKYRDSEGILLLINLKTSQAHGRFFSYTEDASLHLGELFNKFKTIQGGGHALAAGGRIITNNVTQILNDVIETLRSEM